MLLLQSSPDNMGYLIIIIATFFIGIFITRWIFRIDTIVDSMKMQTRLLAKMAKQSGVNENEIREVLGLPLAHSGTIVNDQMAREIRDIAKHNGVDNAIREAAARRGKGIEEAKAYVHAIMQDAPLKRAAPDRDGMITP